MANGHELTRLTLLHRLKQEGGDRDWMEFYRFYWPIVRRWVASKGVNEQMAQDIYQKTVVNVLQKLPDFEHRGEGSFRSWLKTIAFWRLRDEIRSVTKHRKRSNDDPDAGNESTAEQAATGTAHEALADRAWISQIVEDALTRARRRVKPEKWESFQRYVLNGESPEALAGEFGLTVGGIYQHKSSFLDTLREEFLQLLDEHGELPPELRDTARSRKVIREALDSYLQMRHEELGKTRLINTPPAELTAQFELLRRSFATEMAPSAGTWLLLLAEGNLIRQAINASPLTIGSDSTADVVLAYPGISGRHCRLEQRDGQWYGIDQMSTNGTWRNGRRIQESPLHYGDILRLGSLDIVFLTDD